MANSERHVLQEMLEKVLWAEENDTAHKSVSIQRNKGCWKWQICG